MPYHISPKTGNVAPCHATQRKCRYASEEHFDTREEALKNVEETNSHKSFTSLKKKQNSSNDENIYGTLGKDGFLDHASQKKVKVNGIFCPECDAPLEGIENYKRITNYGDLVTCHNCSHQYNNLNAEVRIDENNPSYKVFHDKNEVTKITWHHSTSIDNDDWLEGNQRDCNTVHAGTITAALDRGIGIKARIDQDFLIYELELDESVHVTDEVQEDAEHFHGNLDLEECVRYVNRWEDIASVSIEVDSHCVHVKSVRTVNAEDAKRILSVYNIPSED